MSVEDLVHIHKTKLKYPNANDDFLMEKGEFPYDYIDDESKLAETFLPAQATFYSPLTDQPCSNERYARAKKKPGRISAATP